MRTIAVASGRSGVGKSTVVASLGILFARSGVRTVLMDADLATDSLDGLMGLDSGPTLKDLTEGEHNVDSVLRMHPSGARVLTGCSEVGELSKLKVNALRALIGSLADLEAATDILVLDTAPGLDEGSLSSTASADESVFIVTPDPASLMDAYAAIKQVKRLRRNCSISIIVNQVVDVQSAYLLFQKLQSITREHLNLDLKFLGSIRSCSPQQPPTSSILFLESDPDSEASTDLKQIAHKLLDSSNPSEGWSGTPSFFLTLLERSKKPARAS